MIFMHIVDDFYLQPNSWLVNGKQKAWWQRHAPDKLYRYDYICALLLHGFSWTFITMFPLAIQWHFQLPMMFYIYFVMNTTVHAAIDNTKANRLRINLIQDQLLHIAQIVLTFAFVGVIAS
jgi:hypothetical protein